MNIVCFGAGPTPFTTARYLSHEVVLQLFSLPYVVTHNSLAQNPYGLKPITWTQFAYTWHSIFHNNRKTNTKISNSCIYFIKCYGCHRQTNAFTIQIAFMKGQLKKKKTCYHVSLQDHEVNWCSCVTISRDRHVVTF